MILYVYTLTHLTDICGGFFVITGSDVNSMDSVDSCSTLGVGDGQPSGSQTCQSQSSELIVWEIEVPKVCFL